MKMYVAKILNPPLPIKAHVKKVSPPSHVAQVVQRTLRVIKADKKIAPKILCIWLIDGKKKIQLYSQWERHYPCHRSSILQLYLINKTTPKSHFLQCHRNIVGLGRPPPWV